MPLTIVQPGVGGTGLSTGTPLSSTTAPATNPATGTPSASTYLRGDGTWASIASTSPGGSNTQVQYNSSGSFAGSSNFVWDNSNTRLGIGISSPAAAIDVLGSYLNGGSSRTNTNTKTFGFRVPHCFTATNPMNVIGGLSTTSINNVYIGGSDSNIGGTAATNLLFYTAANNTTADGTLRMAIDSAGNVGIGTSSPGVKLDVSGGDFRIQQSAATARQRFVAGSNQWNVEASNSSNTWGVYDAAAGTANMVLSGSNLQFNSGYGSAATAYGCRAWVSFDGQNTPSIRGSGNVSSITDDGTGRFRVNFTNAMPDANYSAVATARAPGTVTAFTNLFDNSGAYSTTQFALTFYSASDGYIDPSIFNAVVCR